jgi:hypothetical protein
MMLMPLTILKLALMALGLGLILLERVQPFRWTRIVFVILSITALSVVGILVLNHLHFPLHIEVMEGAVLAHFQRAAAGEFIYPEPSPGYVPLAYNPLYYFVSLPLSGLFGVDLLALRLSALIAYAGCMVVVFLIIRARTQSLWWGFAAVGLFAAAYSAMDAYLNTAHSDSWFLFMVLLGTYWIDRDNSRAWNTLGIAALAAAFWFKQHGALFLVGGVVFLIWREILAGGWRRGLWRSIPYILTGLFLGPVLYLSAGDLWFGPRFQYFTWEVPRGWSEFGISTLYRVGVFVVENYAPLALVAAGLFVRVLLKLRTRLNILHTQFIFASLAGLMGALDGGSSGNVFIAMGIWFILMGVMALWQMEQGARQPAGARLSLALLFAAFSWLVYDPTPLITSSNAEEAYVDLVRMLDDLDGMVYAPDITVLEQNDRLYPNAHWVALEDMIRGPSRRVANHTLTRELLAPLLSNTDEAYILSNLPLREKEVLAFLEDDFTLETDFGDRFAALHILPKRFDHGYPRYLYRRNRTS